MQTQLIKLLILCFILFASSSCTQAKYRGPGYESQMYWQLDHYAEQLAKQKDLQFLIAGNVTDTFHIEYCITMRSVKNMTYDEARLFAIGLVEDFWQMLHKDPSVKHYLDSICKELYSHPKQLSLQNVGYKLAFWDANTNRPLPPYIAEVLFVAGTFYYYQAEPETQALRLIHKESYDEAMRFYQSTLERENSSKR